MHEEPLEIDAELGAELDARVIRALERAPQPSIPVDFAARVAAKVPVRKIPASLKPSHYGRNTVWGCLAALFIALLVLSPRFESRSVLWVAFVWLLCLQFLALGVWWSARHKELS